MTHDARITAWKRAVEDRAALAEEHFAKGGAAVTPEDMVAVALAHPESYEIQIRARGRTEGADFRCPDDAVCHHGCVETCWRVGTCEPLSATGWGSTWPEGINTAPRRVDGR